MASIGKYKLENEIGRGGFGRVFRAFDPTVGRTVAIKILIADNDKDLLARFRREATATGKLRHKNIVTIYDYGEQDGTPYLVMEYLEGEDLKTSISAGHISTLFDKTSVMSQVAEGLQHAHHHGIIHRDIKPANIMILSDGTVKIMDFGIARVMSEFTTRLTRHGDVLGTLSYMAPEVLHGTEVDSLCDIFSFGVIYYELVAGKQPFAADQPARVIYNITATQPPPVSTFTPQCPRDLEQLIARSIHRERELRYQSFEDLLFDLMPIRFQLQSAEAQTLIRKAETLVDAKNIQEAQTVVRHVLQLDPNNTIARELREKLNREAQLQVLRQRCEQLIVSGTEQLNALEYAKAIESFEAVLRLDPSHIAAENLLEQARTALRKRERAEALIVQTKRELEADQLTDAYRSILECLQHAPENKEATALLETIRAAIKARERQRRLAEGVDRAEEMLTAERPEEAVALLSDLAVSYPAAQKVKELLAKAASAIEEKKRRRQLHDSLTASRKLLSEKKWADAVSSLSALIKQFPNEDEVQSELAYAQEQLELQRKAEHVEQILREAGSANETRDFECALRLLNAGLRSYPAEPSLKEMLTRTEELQNEHQRQLAIQAARERANELAAQNDFSAALAVIDLTVGTWKTDELKELRGQIQTKQKEFERAQAIAKVCTSIKLYLDRERFEDALSTGQEALKRFSGDPSITALVDTAKARVAEQKRKARIKAVCDEATVTAAEDRFSEAIELLRNAIRELGDDSSLTALHEQIETQKKEHERRQAVAAAVAKLEALLQKSDYAAAVEAGRLALGNFPGETKLTKLVETAERGLSQQRRAQQIAAVQEKARLLASEKNFDSALKLVRSSIQELDSDTALEDLARSIEGLRLEHEKQEAIRAAKSRAQQLMDSREYAKAVALLEQSLGTYQDEAGLKGLLTEAREQLAAQKRSEAIDAILRKARELVQANEFQAALNVVRTGIREYSDDPRLTAMADEIRGAILKMEKERAIRAALNSAAVLQEQGEFGKAAELLELTLTKAPNQAAIQQALALVKEKIATQQKVNAVLDQVLELMSRGSFDEALANVRQALDVFPGELALSSLLEEVKETQRANAVAAAAREVEAFRSAGDLAKASARLEEVLAAFPNESALLDLKSRIQSEIAGAQKRQHLAALSAGIRRLLDEEKLDDAIARLQDALRDHPGEGELTSLYAYAEEIMDARRRAEEISDLAKRSMALLQTGKPQEAETLLKDAVKRYPEEEAFVPLLARAKAEVATLAARERAAQPDAVTSKIEIPREALKAEQTKIAPAAGPSRLVTNILQVKRGRSFPRAIAVYLLALVLGIGLVVWLVLPRSSPYQNQFDSARAYFEKKDYGRAVDALQQIPSSSPLYKEAQSLLASARDAQKQASIQELLAQAGQQHSQNQDQESLSTLQKVLDLDPDNQPAKALRNEIELTDYRNKTRAEQDRYVASALAQGQELFNAGNLDGAKKKIEEVIRVRSDDPLASSLNRRIDAQLEGSRKMNAERSNWLQAKANAETAKASEFDSTRFAAARRAEEAAVRQQEARQFEDAAKKFAEAAGLYSESAKAAEARAAAVRANNKKAEDEGIQLQRTQAESARAQYQQNLAKARQAGAETKARDPFQAALSLASDAQARFDRNDFTGARGGFDQASNGLGQAVDAATKFDIASKQAAEQAAAQRGMETARADMESAKRGLTGRDARAAAQEARAQQLAQDGKLADAASAYQAAASLYRDAAQRESLQTDMNAIRALLDQYKDAYQGKDLDAMKVVFPTMGAAEEGRLRETMRNARTIQVMLDVVSTRVSADTATVDSRMRFTFRAARGSQSTTTDPESVVFNLRRRGGSWVIDSIARR